MINEIKKLVNREIEAIKTIPIDDSYEKAIELIYNKVHKQGGKVIVTGMGKAGQVGLNIATTLCSTGTPAVYVHAAEAQHGDIGVIQQNDILFLISNSGKTREVIEFCMLAHALYEKLPVIILTGNKKSDLAKIADVVLFTGKHNELCPLGLTPTISTTVMMVIGDLLVVQLMKKINFTLIEYGKRHHGGYLGTLSKKMISKK